MLNYKQNHPFPTDIFSTSESIAKEVGLVMRSSRKFSAKGFLLTLLKTVSGGASSYNQMSMEMGKTHPLSMSRQGLSQRFSSYSTAFLLEVISTVISEKATLVTRPFREVFRRILIEDSTVLPIARSNSKEFPGNGNGKVGTAGCKVNLITDLLSGEAVDCSLQAARKSDQSLSDLVLDYVREGDLLIRDMGYFMIDRLAELSAFKVHWVSRLPSSVKVRFKDGRELDEVLADESVMTIDEDMLIGAKAFPCRVVATRLDKASFEANRRKRNHLAKKRGTTQPRKNIIRDGWRIVVTSLDRSMVDEQDLRELYELRWDIEIQFRAMKQSVHLGRTFGRKMGYFQIEALALTTIIHHLLSARCYHVMAAMKGRHKISREKLSDLFSKYILSSKSEDGLWELLSCDPRHLKPERTPSSTPCPAMVHCLT